MSKKNSDLINRYLEFVFVQKNLSKNTLISYQSDLQEFSNIFGKIYLAEKFEQKIDEYIKHLSENFSPKSHCRKLSSVRNFLSYLFDLKIIKKNPTNDIEFPKIPQKVPKFLSEIEVNKLIQKSYENKSFKGLRTTLLIEILYGHFTNKQSYVFMDTLASLSSGMTNILKDVLGLAVILISYPFILEKLAFWEINSSIGTYTFSLNSGGGNYQISDKNYDYTNYSCDRIIDYI